MPIVSYFLCAGCLLVGLLFAADSVLPPREPLKLSSDFHGMGRVAAARPVAPEIPLLTRSAAPESDMSSELVKASQPSEQNAGRPVAAQALARGDVTHVAASVAKRETTTKKSRKNVAQQRPVRSD